MQVRRGKNPRIGKMPDRDKDKTDSTTTNKQDPQDTPAGRRIGIAVLHVHLQSCYCAYKLAVDHRFLKTMVSRAAQVI